MITSDDWEELWKKRDAFAEEFAKLVRKYAPTPHRLYNEKQDALLAMMQDQTSCYSPYVWSSEFDPKEKK